MSVLLRWCCAGDFFVALLNVTFERLKSTLDLTGERGASRECVVS